MRTPHRLLFFIIGLVAPVAFAWDYETQWYDPSAASPTPATRVGGDGLIGTGSWHSGGNGSFGGVTCASCHTPYRSMITAAVALNPAPLLAADGGPRYVPNTAYAVTVTMNGEHVFKPDGGPSENGFAGEVEFPDGGYAGTVDSDTPGFTHSPCATRSALATISDAGTTVVYSDCHAVLHRSKPGLTQWHFTWTAPPAGFDNAILHYGVVDGAGNERSKLPDGGYNDDVVFGSYVLRP
jgi:hypothetical protein